VSKVLPAATAFHSSHLEPMKNEFNQVLSTVGLKPPKMSILRNLDCKVYQSKEDIVEGLTLQNTNPVLFTQSVEELIKK
jgi:malonyl CoA-acyl carrier protein transacylase